MRNILLLFLSLMLLAVGPVWATGLCFGSSQDLLHPSPADYSCTVGGLTFSNFQLISQYPVDASYQLKVGSLTGKTGNVITLALHTDIGPSADLQDISWSYEVSGGIKGIDAHLTGGSGSTWFNESVCTAPIDPINGCTGTVVGTLAVSTAINSASMLFDQDYSRLWVKKDINIPAGGSTLSDFAQTFVVPEPVTLMLIGSGLLALGLLRRRLV